METPTNEQKLNALYNASRQAAGSAKDHETLARYYKELLPVVQPVEAAPDNVVPFTTDKA